MTGVICDAHELVRPEVLEGFQRVAFILHAGDIGQEDVSRKLERIAPVTAVRGDSDRQPWAIISDVAGS